MLLAGFIMAALDAGVPLRDVQIAARHVDLRTTTIYERRRGFFDDVAAFTAVAADDAVAPPVGASLGGPAVDRRPSMTVPTTFDPGATTTVDPGAATWRHPVPAHRSRRLHQEA